MNGVRQIALFVALQGRRATLPKGLIESVYFFDILCDMVCSTMGICTMEKVILGSASRLMAVADGTRHQLVFVSYKGILLLCDVTILLNH